MIHKASETEEYLLLPVSIVYRHQKNSFFKKESGLFTAKGFFECIDKSLVR